MNDVQEFIQRFCNHTRYSDAGNVLYEQFASGYCWHFAHMLKDTFQRGTVVWLAPFGHIGFQDVDGTVYDICGKYDGEAFYEIPEAYLGCLVDDFRHAGAGHNATKEELIEVCRKFCMDTGTRYDAAVEAYFA